MTSQKLNGLFGISWKIKMKNVHLLTISLLVQIVGGNIGNVMLRWLLMSLSKVGVDPKRYDPSQFWKDLYGVIQTQVPPPPRVVNAL